MKKIFTILFFLCAYFLCAQKKSIDTTNHLDIDSLKSNSVAHKRRAILRGKYATIGIIKTYYFAHDGKCIGYTKTKILNKSFAPAIILKRKTKGKKLKKILKP